VMPYSVNHVQPVTPSARRRHRLDVVHAVRHHAFGRGELAASGFRLARHHRRPTLRVADDRHRPRRDRRLLAPWRAYGRTDSTRGAIGVVPTIAQRDSARREEVDAGARGAGRYSGYFFLGRSAVEPFARTPFETRFTGPAAGKRNPRSRRRRRCGTVQAFPFSRVGGESYGTGSGTRLHSLRDSEFRCDCDCDHLDLEKASAGSVPQPHRVHSKGDGRGA